MGFTLRLSSCFVMNTRVAINVVRLTSNSPAPNAGPTAYPNPCIISKRPCRQFYKLCSTNICNDYVNVPSIRFCYGYYCNLLLSITKVCTKEPLENIKKKFAYVNTSKFAIKESALHFLFNGGNHAFNIERECESLRTLTYHNCTRAIGCTFHYYTCSSYC